MPSFFFFKYTILLVGLKFTQMPRASIDPHPRSEEPVLKAFGAKSFIPPDVRRCLYGQES